MINVFTMLNSMQCLGTGVLIIFSVVNIALLFIVLTIKNSTVFDRRSTEEDLLSIYYDACLLNDKLYISYKKNCKRADWADAKENLMRYDNLFRGLLVKKGLIIGPGYSNVNSDKGGE